MEQPKPKFEFRNRSQVYLGPVDLEALIGAEHPARAIWALLETLDFSRFEEQILSREGQAGRAAVPPRLLAALWIYSYSEAIGSARALERMQAHEPGLRWLCADDPINHKTLSDFRTQHGEALDALFSEVLAAMERGGLVDLSTVAHDGTKVQAASGRSSFHRRPTLQESLKRAKRVVKKMKEQAMADGEEGADKKRQAAQQRAAQERLERTRRSLQELRKREKKAAPDQRAELRVSDSEPEARKMKLADGSFAPAYNVQISTETRSAIIVGVDATQQVNDTGQLVGAIRQIQRRTQRKPDKMLVDGGYATRENVEYASRKKILLYAPWKAEQQREAGALKRNGIAAEYGPSAFVQASGEDRLICPQGQPLERQGTARKHGQLKVIYEAAAATCGGCEKKAMCCPQDEIQRGRRVDRVVESAAMNTYLDRMASEEGKQQYKQRSRFGEFPQMQIKSRMGLRRFHVRGLAKVRQEVKWWALAYNFAQWVRLGWKKTFQTNGNLQPVTS
jgi:transposase